MSPSLIEPIGDENVVFSDDFYGVVVYKSPSLIEPIGDENIKFFENLQDYKTMSPSLIEPIGDENSKLPDSR